MLMSDRLLFGPNILYGKSMKCGIQEELLLSFLDTKYVWLPAHAMNNIHKHLIEFCKQGCL